MGLRVQLAEVGEMAVAVSVMFQFSAVSQHDATDMNL